MRLLLSLALAAACVSAAHASTIRDDFTYRYVLDGNTHVTTFSLLDGQAATSATSKGATYAGVVLNNDPTSTAIVTFGIPFAGIDYGDEYGIIYDNLDVFIAPTLNPSLREGIRVGGDRINVFNGSAFTFYRGTSHSIGDIDVSGTPLRVFASLTIAQTVLPDPPPAVYNPTPINLPINLPATAVTPEPGTLTLLGTGMLGVAAAARRRLLRTA